MTITIMILMNMTMTFKLLWNYWTILLITMLFRIKIIILLYKIKR
jgi:hypothetical protein